MLAEKKINTWCNFFISVSSSPKLNNYEFKSAGNHKWLFYFSCYFFAFWVACTTIRCKFISSVCDEYMYTVCYK